MDNELNGISKAIAESPWKNAYWFARMLINGDKYGAVGTNKESQIVVLSNRLETLLAQSALKNDEKLAVCKETF